MKAFAQRLSRRPWRLGTSDSESVRAVGASRAAGTMLTFVGLFLLSAATLLFEINLTRLFSVAQFYHFAFMIVSLALLGFGASGSALALIPSWRERSRVERTLTWLALGFSASCVGSVLLINWLPFDSFSIAWDRRQLGVLALHYLVLATPFFCSGAAVGLLLSARPAIASRTYFVNLLGSAAGCLLALITPGVLGGEGVVLLSGALGAATVLLFGSGGHGSPIRRRSWLPVGLLATMMVVLVVHPQAMAVRLSPYKDLSHLLNVSEAQVISSRWNAFSRVDLVQSSSIRSLPGLSYRYLGELPSQHGLTIDGDDLSGVVIDLDNQDFADYLPGALAYHLNPAANSLLLEPQGGLDILVAHAQGAQSITAVEPNPLVVNAAKEVYGLPGVEAVVEAGRSFLRRTRPGYDIVTVCLTTPYRPVRSGAYSLSEEYRYTVEGFEDGLSRLAPDGILQATRWLQASPSEETRLFALVVEALERRGADPAQTILYFRGYNTATVLARPGGFTGAELEMARGWLSARSFDLVYAPGVRPDEVNRYNQLPEPVYYQAATGLLSAPDRASWYADSPYDVTPPWDDHPFFGHYFKWSQAAQVWQEAGHTWQPFGGAGYFVLLALLVLATIAALGVILLPLVAGRRSGQIAKVPGRLRIVTVAYFGLIGFGFLFGEIPLAQQFILFLGQPVYGLTAVLFALLFFSGVGSWMSVRLPHRPALIALVIVLPLYPFALPQLFSLFLGSPQSLRLLVAVTTLAPLGFLLGIPFPKGIAWLEEQAAGLIPWAWGVNGAASVVASVSAALLALSFGFSWVLLAGALCYAGALGIVTLSLSPSFSFWSRLKSDGVISTGNSAGPGSDPG
jgi:hypothetical protein